MTTPISVFMSGQKKDKNATLARQTLGATCLKYRMRAQFNFGSVHGGILPGYTSFHWCVMRKSSKKRTSELHLDLRS